jgi:hypothetical protein
MKRLAAGVAEVDITPSAGGLLSGDLGPAPSTGVDAPLLAKALVLSDDEVMVAIITLDLFSLRREDAQDLTQQVAIRTGLSPEAVMVLASHTRGAPLTAAVPGAAELDTATIATLQLKLPELVVAAQSGMQDASLGIGHAILPHLIYNHRLMTRNMKAVSAWLGVPRNEVLAPEGPTDPQFSVFVVRDDRGRPLALLWSLAAENRFSTGGRISAGLPGTVQQLVDARIGRHVPCLYLGGCGSNISYVYPLEEAADAVASAVMAVQLETPADPMIRLGSAAERVILPVRDASRAWNRSEVELKAPQAADTFAREAELLEAEGAQAVPATVQAIRFGRYALACLPGAPFVEFALRVKEGSPFRETVVVGTNDDAGFVIPRSAFDHGGLESWPSRSARVGPGGGEYAADVAAELLQALWRA